MARVLLENISKRFDDATLVVKSVNLTIEDKEFVVLVGPSGCGKSTTLRMIAGLEEISDGKIYIDDVVVNDVPPKDRDIAMVFQNYALYPHMSVFENLAFGLKLRKYNSSEIESRVHQAADILGIKHLLDRKPKALSGGQRQRVALGRAIVRRPKVFLFDEPLSNLDANLRVQMRTEISKLHRRLETTMIYVTHDQIEAMSMGDRIVVMKDGVVQQVDSPLNIYNTPVNKFVAGFIGSPTINFFDGRITNGERLRFDHTASGMTIPIPAPYAARLSPYLGREVTMGIRPEHISATPHGSNGHAIRVEIDVTEPVGNEIFVYFSVGSKGQYVSRIQTDVHPVSGTSMELFFDTLKLHFFDKGSGSVL